MNFTQINYFLTVAKTLSFTKAANMLYITQPAISRQIIMMENELGFKLFTRANRSLHLTPEGFVMAAELDKVALTYDNAIVKAKNAGNALSGRLRVGITEGMDVDEMVSATLRRLAEEVPEIDIALFNFGMEETILRLMEDRLDIAFVRKYGVENRESMDWRHVAASQEQLAVSPDNPLAGRESATVEDLRDTVLILVSETEEDVSRKLILDICAQHGFTPQLKFSPSYHANLLWAKSNSGVMLVDTFDIMPETGLLRIPFEQTKDTDLVLAWYDRNFNPARLKFENTFFEVNKLPNA